MSCYPNSFLQRCASAVNNVAQNQIDKSLFPTIATRSCGANCNIYSNCPIPCGCGGGCGCGCSCPTASCCDTCEQQLKYVLSQLITVYSGSTWVITLQSGATVTLTPDSITTSINRGLLYDTQTNTYINICDIAYITIAGATYSAGIQYLPNPLTQPECGCSYSIYSTLALLTTGSTVNFTVNGTALGAATVVANYNGIVVTTSAAGLRFINACAIESFVVIPPTP